MNRRDFLRRAGLASAGLASLPVFAEVAQAGGADHVRWDILSVDFSTTPTTLRPGGVAFASADTSRKIKLTGSGTFVAPASGKPSGAVTGGGTWETFEGTTSTGNGTYAVTRLVDWEFATFQTGTFIDLIGNTNERANGNVILRIEYSDGSNGILGVGCEGPGAPEGIQEGVIATKGFVTYWTRQAPTPGVDKNRTLFHVTK
ncbi:MAG TPA: twin-arginine translocation signal domain-containing protein [Candidatus Dormibacteraeota bacterium]|nr:twin-arginine translocation signal domain-containing protein [Candidatus Dormibacteraeota bacterium]